MMQKRLGELLLEQRSVTPADLEQAVERSRKVRQRLGDLLIDEGLAPETEVYRALAAQQGMRFAALDEIVGKLDPALSARLPRAYQEQARLIPICREGKTLLVATTNPVAWHPELPSALGVYHVELLLVCPTDFRRLRLARDLELGAVGATSEVSYEATRQIDEEGDIHADDERAGALLDQLLLDAIHERASDLHLEVYNDRVRIRIRVDGDLRDLRHYQFTRARLLGLINVVKVRASLDIAERRVPQGGRFTVKAGEHVYDLRVQTQPSLHGEHIVLRLLPQDTKLVSIAELGFPPALAKTYRRLLDSPAGLILIVGPTGSGKSTTLYAGLQVLAQETDRKVITVEDPIERALDGIQQTAVRPDLGFSFANALRSFLRQDPDVILVGEIRDAETAMEALRASQTGHMVLSTLHCNDSVEAAQRLIDLGMHPNSIASELLAVFAQRLAKRICDGCRTPHKPSAELLEEVFGGPAPQGLTFHRGKGCSRCAGEGTYGRIAVVEHLPASWQFRRAIVEGRSLDELRAMALEAGLVSMRDRALDHVAEGIISLEELPQFLTPEQLRPRHLVVPGTAEPQPVFQLHTGTA
ncbi:MAG: ATPase, T2SS/T4P/T4SS family [Gemmatimonadales bacterium]|nr:ATPase, T2SS/T4P/T4SS family [Gemmatimonadales bacterium]